MHQAFDEALKARIEQNLRAFPVRRTADRQLRHAAVAIVCVADVRGRPGFLLTRRPSGMRAHGGQWALPGGRVDHGEDAERAARRELAEELGYRAGDLLGRLDDFATRSGYRITPVVLWGDVAPDLAPNPAEVEAVHVVPFADVGTVRFVRIPQSDRPVVQLPVLGTLLHAPTGAVLHQFLEVGLRNRHTRVDSYEQPLFAWR